MLQRLFKYVLGLVCLPFMLYSCEDCNNETDNIPFATVGFYDKETGNPIDTSFNRIVGVIARSGEPMADSVRSYSEGYIYDSTRRNTKFELPLFTRIDSSMFLFNRGKKLDTLSLRYKVQVEILTPDCGYDEKITDLEVYFHSFKEVEVVQSTLTQIKTADTHIKIYD